MPADLASLMQIAPITAAGMVGQQQAQDFDMNNLRQQELAQLISSRLQDQQFNVQKQPFELDKLRLGNEGLTQDNLAKDLTNQKTKGTLASEIDNTNSKNSFDTYQRVGSQLGSIASAIDDNPDMPPHMAISQALQGAGMSPGQTEALMKRYSKVPPGQLAKRLREDSEKILRSNPAYAQAVDTQGMQNKTALEQTRMNNASAQEVAKIQANSRVQVAQEATERRRVTIEQRIQQAKSARERHSILIDAAMLEHQAGNDAAAQQYMQRAEAIRPQAEAEIARFNQQPGSVDTSQMGVPTVPQGSIAPPNLGGPQPQPNPQPSPNEPRIPVIHPDGRRGSVPASQLQQALSRGFKRAQ